MQPEARKASARQRAMVRRSTAPIVNVARAPRRRSSQSPEPELTESPRSPSASFLFETGPRIEVPMLIMQVNSESRGDALFRKFELRLWAFIRWWA